MEQAQSAASRHVRRDHRVLEAATPEHQSTPPAHGTSPLKSSVRCAFSTARCSARFNQGVEPHTERSGAKRQVPVPIVFRQQIG